MSAVQNLVVVGRDAPVWLAACVMQSALAPAGLRVTVVELPDVVGAGDVYATLPALEPLHARLRIEESRLISATRGAFTLGKRFQDVTGQAAAFFHAYGSTGARIDDTDFLPNWIKARHFGLPVAFEDFCLTAAAAKHSRMLLPDAEIERNGFTDYGYHLPAIPYVGWLRQLALHRGVVRHKAQDLEILMTPDGTDIAGVALDDDRRVMGDFFIDATGPGALLLAGKLGVKRESWHDSFPADRVLVAHAPPIPSQPSYADIRAGEAGWLALHPTRDCTHVVHAFSSDTANHRAIETAESLSELGLHDVEIRASNPGRRVVAWHRNCVGIGEAACVLDPIHGVDLQSVQLGLVHLLPLFPVDADYTVERDEYNKNLQSGFERIRDFQSAHYVLNRYRGAFWERARLSPVSRDLLRRIGIFRARGEVAHYEDESFSIDDWQALMLGHGVLPETWDPAVDRTPPELLKNELRRILGFIRRKVEEQRSHAEYLQSASVASAAPSRERRSD